MENTAILRVSAVQAKHQDATMKTSESTVGHEYARQGGVSACTVNNTSHSVEFCESDKQSPANFKEDPNVAQSAAEQRRQDEEIMQMLDAQKIDNLHKEMARITPYRRHILKVTFAPLHKKRGKNGLNIMLRLFAEHPEYKNIWPQFKQIPDSALCSADALFKHAYTYMNGLKNIIDNIEDDEKLEVALRRIAHAHVKWNIHKHHLIDQLPCLLAVMGQHVELNETVRESWKVLFDVLANMIDIFRD